MKQTVSQYEFRDALRSIRPDNFSYEGLGMWKITYTYDNPSGAGPFKGSAIVTRKYAKGDHYAAVFGSATVKSCRVLKMR